MNHRYQINLTPFVSLILSLFFIGAIANNAGAQSFCIPAASDCSQKDEILNVIFGSLNNSSSRCSGSGYSNYTSLAAPVIAPGSTVQLSVTAGPGGNDNLGLWIDWNRNGSFEAAEYTYIGNTTSASPLLLIKDITAPADASLGLTRMRIRMRYASGGAGISAADSCSTFLYGETEDYTINISTCKPPSAATTSGDTSLCVSGNVALRVIGGSLGDATDWKWYSGSCGGTPAGTGTSITVSPTVTTTYYVRAEGGCVTPGNCSAVKVTINGIPGAPVINPITPFCQNVAGALVINPFTFDTNNPVADSVTVRSGALAIDIPDETEDGVSTDLLIPALPVGAQMTGIEVTINMTHTYIGDMVFNLKAPNGTIIALDKYLGGTGNDGANFVNTMFTSRDTASLAYGIAPFTRRFAPDAINADINGVDVQNPTGFVSTADDFTELYSTPAGTWTLAMADGGPADLGTLNNWSLKIIYNKFSQIPSFPALWSPAGSLYTDAAGTVPYDSTTTAFQVYAKPAATTTYTAISQNGNCKSAAATVTVTVNVPASFTLQPLPVTTCEFGTVVFAADAKGTAPTYQWLVNTGTGYTAITDNSNYSGSATKALTVKDVPASWNNYKYRAVVTSAVPCTATDTTTEVTLAINPTPVVSITAVPYTKLLPGLSTVITASSVPAAASYSWYRNEAILSSATANTLPVSVDELGAYKAVVTDVNGCVGSSPDLIIQDSVSGKLFVFPNPAKGLFQVRYYSVPGNVSLPRTLLIYDAKGALVLNKTYSIDKPYDKMEVNFNRYGKGVYMINLLDRSGNRLAAGRVLIQ